MRLLLIMRVLACRASTALNNLRIKMYLKSLPVSKTVVFNRYDMEDEYLITNSKWHDNHKKIPLDDMEQNNAYDTQYELLGKGMQM